MKRTRAILKDGEEDNRAPKRGGSESLAARRKAIEEKYKAKPNDPPKNRKFGALMGQNTGGGILQRRRMTEEERLERRKKLDERLQARKDGQAPVNEEMEKLRRDAQEKRMARARARLLRTRRIKGCRISFQPAFLTKEQEGIVEEQVRKLENGEFEYSEDEHESAKEYSRSPSPRSYRDPSPIEGDYYRPGRGRQRRRSYSRSSYSSYDSRSRSRGRSYSRSSNLSRSSRSGRSYSQSRSPRGRGRAYSQSRSPRGRGRAYSQSRSPRGRSQSPRGRRRSYSRSPRGRSRSYSSRRSYSVDSRDSRYSRDSRDSPRNRSPDSRRSDSRRSYSADSRHSREQSPPGDK